MLPYLAYGFIKLLHATLRVRHVRASNLKNTPQHILAFWHEDVLLSLQSLWRKPTTAMISRSKDGEIVSRVLHLYGAETARGSSTRGGEIAVREVLRDVRAGKNIAVTPDGPKGPRRIVKEGVVFIAQLTALPIVPFYFTAKRKKRLRSWDQQIFPIPFSKAIYIYGEPIAVPRDGNVEEWRLKIEQAMNALAEEAERDFDILWKTT
ncbi:MAG TPA: lysophospholipid acyltransferase family protein [Thermoanaerobaculia bacterium]|nr:lysophospholipid acyltransferase family protein [Thermoanaerobaculia bacterium]